MPIRDLMIAAQHVHDHVMHLHRLHALFDRKQTIEILRSIHSFAPCLACAVRVAGDDGGETVTIRIA